MVVGRLKKALLYLGEQLPWVAKSQKTPSSENGLEKGVCLDLETVQFLWWVTMNRHQTTTKGASSDLPVLALGALLKGVVVMRLRKVVGQASPRSCP